ncbi:MAG: homocysteine S-methyltransferase family protein [Thermoleophilia bacterium]|nr:homocysteine S-methyltransferase family protein [Thermoleophilia bacterium]
MDRTAGTEGAARDASAADRSATGDPPRTASLGERLAGVGAPLLLDGATGTELERAGLPTGLPLWSTHALLEAPECVLAIHRAYRAAGAEIVTANSFRTQRRTLARAGLGDADARLTGLAVTLARLAIAGDAAGVPVAARAAGRVPSLADGAGPPASGRAPRAWVAGSLPPLEDCYRPDLVPGQAELAREHGRQAELLGEAGVDLFLVETMNSVREARAAAAAVARTGLPCVVGFVAWEGARLLSGESLSEAAREMIDCGAAAVGVNCLPPANLEACRRALAGLAAPLLVSPNLGVPEPRTGFARDDSQGPATFVAPLEAWLAPVHGGNASARIVGGCCGTTPAHIAALASRLRRGRPEDPP